MTTCNDMVTSSPLYHVGYEFGGNGSSALVFLVLAGIGKKWENSGDSFCTCNLACMDHYAEFHEGSIDGTTTGIDNVDIVFSYRLCNADAGFANTVFGDLSF